MSELDEVRAALPGVRSQVKAAQRLLRATTQVLADFEERLDALDAQSPKEGTANEHHLNPGQRSTSHTIAAAGRR